MDIIEAAKAFHIGDILTVTTGKFVTPNGMDGLYQILDWMTGESLMTHQLPRASEECAPSLREQLPMLAAIEPPDWEGVPRDDIERAVYGWVEEMAAQYGEWHDVRPLAPEDHTRIDPIAELKMMRPDMPIIAVTLDQGEETP